MAQQEAGDPATQLAALKTSLREVAHDISNPLGILRMAVYYLQTANPTEEKREHYYQVINQTLDKIEAALRQIRTLSGSQPQNQIPPPPDTNAR